MNTEEYPKNWSNKEHVKKRLDLSSHAFRYATPELKDDKEFVLDLLKNHYSKRFNQIVKYCSSRLKNDREVALAAIKNNWRSVQYINKQLQSHPKVVELVYKKQFKEYKEHFKYDKHSLRSADDSIKSNKNLMLSLMPLSPYVFQYCSEDLKNDPQVALKCFEVTNNINYVQLHLGPQLKEEVGDKDLEKYLTFTVLYEKLDSKIEVKKEAPKKLKI